MPTPCEVVAQHYELPFKLYPYQERTINTLAPLCMAGYYLDMGLGKTIISMVAALYRVLERYPDRIIIVVPPVLITGWARFVSSIKHKKTGKPLNPLVYRGTPKQRMEMDLNADIIIVGIQIFKQDFDRFERSLEGVKALFIVDEAHCLKNVGTDNHEKIYKMRLRHDLMLLTGTPINSPGDAYGMIKLIAPGTYLNLNQFLHTHVAAWDFYDNVMAWKNLDLLRENLAINSVRLLKEDCIDDLPPVTYDPMFYDLHPDHLKLYRKLAEEHLIPLKDGGKVDATTVQALLHALGQIVCNWANFAQDERKVSAGFQLIDEVLDELGNGKLVLFSNYKMTNRAALKHCAKYNPVAIFGGIAASERDKAIDTFVDDPSCRVFIGNPVSAGFGIDRLQHVCSTVMFLEAPISVTAFTQSLSRVHRVGQTKPVTVKIATAERTLQVRQLKALIDKEDLVQTLTGGYQSIREALGL